MPGRFQSSTIRSGRASRRESNASSALDTVESGSPRARNMAETTFWRSVSSSTISTLRLPGAAISKAGRGMLGGGRLGGSIEFANCQSRDQSRSVNARCKPVPAVDDAGRYSGGVVTNHEGGQHPLAVSQAVAARKLELLLVAARLHLQRKRFEARELVEDSPHGRRRLARPRGSDQSGGKCVIPGDGPGLSGALDSPAMARWPVSAPSPPACWLPLQRWLRGRRTGAALRRRTCAMR